MSYQTPKFQPNTDVRFCAIQILYGRVTTLKDYFDRFKEEQGKLYWENGNLVKLTEYKGTITSLRWDNVEEKWIYSVAVLSVTGDTIYAHVPEEIITYNFETEDEFVLSFSKYKYYTWDEGDKIIEKIKRRCEEEIKEIKGVYKAFLNSIEEK